MSKVETAIPVSRYPAFLRTENREQPENGQETVPQESLIREVVNRDKSSLRQPLAPRLSNPPVWKQTFLDRLNDVALHPSRPLLAASFHDKDNSLRFFNFNGNREIITIKMNHEPVGRLVFSPDGNHLMTSGQDGLRLHHVGRLLEGNQDSAVSIKHSQSLTGAQAISAAFSSNGQELIVATINSQAVHVIPLNNSQQPKTFRIETAKLEEDMVNSISVSQNGIIAVGSDNGHAYLINASEKHPRVEKFNTFGGVVAFTPDGDSVITAGQEQHLYRIDLAKFRVFQNHSFAYVLSASKVYQYTQNLGQNIHSLAVSPDGKLVAAGGSGQVYLLSRHDGKVLADQPVEGSTFHLEFKQTSKGYLLMIGNRTNDNEEHTTIEEAHISLYELPQNL